MMGYTLSANIKAGQKIKTQNGWRNVKGVNDEGVEVKEGLVKFGAVIYGWKIK